MTNTDSTGTFRHDPLDLTGNAIRLLQILPGNSTSIIQCRLIHCSHSITQYSCLSYVWGDTSVLKAISVNKKHFVVRQNLWDFLRTARAKRMHRLFWIDAICIDQDNISERNHQVQRMSEIYGMADKVFVWLGHMPGLRFGFSPTYRVLDFLAARGVQRVPRGLVQILLSLETRFRLFKEVKYWERAWIFQEVILARKPQLMMGSSIVDFRKFAQIYIIWVRAIGDRALHGWPIPGSGLYFICKSVNQGRRELTLQDWMQLLPSLECFDRRDRVYAMTGICKEFIALPVRYEFPGYQLSMEVCHHVRPGSLSSAITLLLYLRGAFRLAEFKLYCSHRSRQMLLNQGLLGDNIGAEPGGRYENVLLQAYEGRSLGSSGQEYSQHCEKCFGWYEDRAWRVDWQQSIRLNSLQTVLRVWRE